MTASYDICLANIWSDSKEEVFSCSWSTRNDLLTFDLPVFISKLSECKKIEFSEDFLAGFSDFSVSINDIVQIDFQFHFILIVTAY